MSEPSITDAQKQGLFALERRLREERGLLDALQHAAGECFLIEVGRLASMYGTWDFAHEPALVNLMVLDVVFRALRQRFPLHIRSLDVFERILRPSLRDCAAKQSNHCAFELTYAERAELIAVANRMELVSRFIPGHAKRTLIMAIVCSSRDAEVGTLYSLYLEAIFNELCDAPLPKRDRATEPCLQASCKRKKATENLSNAPTTPWPPDSSSLRAPQHVETPAVAHRRDHVAADILEFMMQFEEATGDDTTCWSRK
jgi:hypothetical protein